MLATAGFVAAPPAAAEITAACPWTQGYPPADLNPTQQIDYAETTATVRVGPYGACTATNSYAPGQSLTVNCYVTNSYGNTWSYIRGSGWVWDANLRYGGAGALCKFP
ncbi:hypothetical protein ACFYPN_32525 [Streptomyces sp. NPDC005576]|uniref:hypothetical protein n=1 Tax=Streptomyces sp. NPDC005576 TaxID=3364726 RepID=UPI0036C8C6EC